MKTDKERKELAEDIMYLGFRRSIDINHESLNKQAFSNIQIYEQPYIDRIKELEKSINDILYDFKNIINDYEVDGDFLSVSIAEILIKK